MDSRPAAVIFDLDGTLIDSLPGIEFSLKAAFDACGVRGTTHDLRSKIGPPIRTILERAGNVTDERKLVDLEKAFRKSYDDEGWRMTACYPEVPSVLRAMHNVGIRLFVVTNKPLHISAQILEWLCLTQLFAAVITRESRQPPYPGKKEMLDFLTAIYSVDPTSCVFVGDTKEDADAAAASSIPFAFVGHGYGSISEVPTTHVHYKVNTFPELYQLLAAPGVCP
ncbi:MAG TPA: HAD family hydrolase [Nitrospira sp.]|nr:HAD family hydrolase [Nitrospira sp.]